MNNDVLIGLLGSAIMAYAIPKLSPFIDYFSRNIFHIFIRKIPEIIKGPFRKARLKKLKEIRKVRYNQDEVVFQSIKAHAYFMLFWGFFAFYMLLLVNGPLHSLFTESTLMGLISVSPLYVFEIFWLREASKAKKLVKQRGLLTKKKGDRPLFP